MLTDRACFILGERAECNTRRCVSKNVTKKLSKCQSGIQLGCGVGSWEAIPKALQASRQAEWDVSTCDWDTHSQFGFWERAYSRISVPGGHVRQRAGAHFGKRPEGADKTVLGNADQTRRNLEGEGATKLCAGRLGTIVEKTADDSAGLMQSNTDGGLQLEQEWSEYCQKVFHNAHWGRKAGDRGQEAGKNHVLVHTIPTTNFKFLDICNYLGPSTSYERWVKMYGSNQTKSWLPYEWLDCADRLHYDGLSLNRCWFLKLKNEFVLLLEEYEDCKRVFWSREWEHLTVGWSITTIWMSAASRKHKKKGKDFTQGFVSTFSKTLCHSWVCPCSIVFKGCFKVGICQSCMPPKKRRMKC